MLPSCQKASNADGVELEHAGPIATGGPLDAGGGLSPRARSRRGRLFAHVMREQVQSLTHRKSGVDEHLRFVVGHRIGEHGAIARSPRSFEAPAHTVGRHPGIGPHHELSGATTATPWCETGPALPEAQGLLPHISTLPGVSAVGL